MEQAIIKSKIILQEMTVMHFTDTDIYKRLLSEILSRGIQIEDGGYICPPGYDSANNFVTLFPNTRDSSLNSRIESSLQSIEIAGLITAHKTTQVGDIVGISYTAEQKGRIEATLGKRNTPTL